MADLTPDPIDVIAEALSRRTPAEVGGEPITDAYLPRGVAVVVANALTEAGLQVIPISAGLKPEWLTRMANACRNMQDQAAPKNVEWFDWVPESLYRAAAELGRANG